MKKCKAPTHIALRKRAGLFETYSVRVPCALHPDGVHTVEAVVAGPVINWNCAMGTSAGLEIAQVHAALTGDKRWVQKTCRGRVRSVLAKQQRAGERRIKVQDFPNLENLRLCAQAACRYLQRIYQYIPDLDLQGFTAEVNRFNAMSLWYRPTILREGAACVPPVALILDIHLNHAARWQEAWQSSRFSRSDMWALNDQRFDRALNLAFVRYRAFLRTAYGEESWQWTQAQRVLRRTIKRRLRGAPV